MRDRLNRNWLRLAAVSMAASFLALVPRLSAQQSQTQQSPPEQTNPAADSVADAARKSKADKAKAKKVYTEEDMPSLKSDGLSVVGEQPAAPAQGAADTQGAPADPNQLNAKPAAGKTAAAPGPKDEAYWRGRAKKIRDQMNDLDSQISTLQDEMQKGGKLAVDPKSGLGQNVIYLEDRSAKMKALQKKRDELQAQMDALEEEARRADIPIGWLR